MESIVWMAATVLPLLAAFILLIFFRSKVVWWEYGVLFGLSLLSGTSVFIFKAANTADKEFWSDRVMKVSYYEPWDEYVHRTCTRTVDCGKDCTTTETYDCSYVDDHPAEWTMETEGGHEYNISQGYYRQLKARFATQDIFVDMHRDFHSYDGDKYETHFDGDQNRSKVVVTDHSYKNKTQSAYTIFKFKDIDQEKAKKLGLFEYPEIGNYFEQTVVLGEKIHPLLERRFQYTNGYFGPRSQIKIFILVFKNKPIDIVEDQKSYWKGGNKNEMVICIGEDDKGNVVWKNSFSWCKETGLEVATLASIKIGKKPNWVVIDKTMRDNMGLWKRRNFQEFDYISIELSRNQIIWALIILLIVNISVSVWVVKNDIDNE